MIAAEYLQTNGNVIVWTGQSEYSLLHIARDTGVLVGINPTAHCQPSIYGEVT